MGGGGPIQFDLKTTEPPDPPSQLTLNHTAISTARHIALLPTANRFLKALRVYLVRKAAGQVLKYTPIGAETVIPHSHLSTSRVALLVRRELGAFMANQSF